MKSLDRITVASRVFCIAAILGMALFSRDAQVIVSLVIIATLATAAIYISLATPLATALVVTVEALLTGLIIGLALPGGVIFLPYLVVLTLIAGISLGIVGVSAAVVAQFLAIVVVATLLSEVADERSFSAALSPWFLTSIGSGLLGAWLRHGGRVPERAEGDAAYESARRLLSQLRTVARRLSSGLDPVTMSTQVLGSVRQALDSTHLGVFVRTDGSLLSPLAYSDDAARASLVPDQYVTDECWAEMEPTVSRTADHTAFMTVLPLRVGGARMIGVVLAESRNAPTRAALKELMPGLDDYSIRLDAALAFDEVRSIATVEERRRLAREIHDGIAQEVASLGYLVDSLIASAESPQQLEDLGTLRDELSRMVSELRLSIFDLRSEVMPESGLGSALSDYVRQVGSRSMMTVHLTLDEAPTRLRAETETELLRIAQEAITNARKHSGADNLWVNCVVKPPFAKLEIRDDGRGLSTGRSDSYGLRIMHERAQRLDAKLEIETGGGQVDRPGTMVVVKLGEEPILYQKDESEPVDDSEIRNQRSPRR